MKKILTSVLLAGFLFAFALPVSAQTETMEDLQTRIQELMEQVQSLKAQLADVEEEATELREQLRLERQLDRGDEGEDVETLQEVLSTDPSVYPEGLVTGYYGPLTEQAVRRLQERFGMEQAGRVGPKTLEHVNYILENGAGNSGNVPPGLLKKFAGESTLQNLPEEAKARCESVENRPDHAAVPSGIFAECDDNDEDDEEEGEDEEEETDEESEDDEEDDDESDEDDTDEGDDNTDEE